MKYRKLYVLMPLLLLASFIVSCKNKEAEGSCKDKLYIIETYNRKMGLINTNGKEIFKPVYNHIHFCEQFKLGFALSDSTVKIFETHGEITHQVRGKYKPYEVQLLSQKLIVLSDKNIFNVWDFKKKQRMYAGRMIKNASGEQPITAIQLEKGWVYIDENGRQIVDIFFDDMEEFFDFGKVCLDGQWGLVDETGEFVLECEYEDVKNWGWSQGSYCIAKQNGRWFIVSEGKQKVLFNKSGYDEVLRVSENLLFCKRGDQTFMLSQDFEEFPCDFGRAYLGVEGKVLRVRESDLINKMWLTDLRGNKLSDNAFYFIDSFYEGIAAAFVKDCSQKAGFIDHKGQWIIPPKFTGASAFSEGLACVTYDDGNDFWVGYINREGDVQFKFYSSNSPNVHTKGRPFKDGMAWVETPNRKGYINKNNKWIWRITR